MKHVLIITAILALGSLAQVSRAQFTETAMNPPPSFEQVDANKDGVISQQEALNAKVLNKQQFQAADKDGNGVLSKNEYQSAIAQLQKKSTKG